MRKIMIIFILMSMILVPCIAEAYCPMPAPRIFGPTPGYRCPIPYPYPRPMPRPYYYRYNDNSDFYNIASLIINLATLASVNNQANNQKQSMAFPPNYVQTEYGAVPIEVYEKFMKNKE